jgi:hypothetical protein
VELYVFQNDYKKMPANKINRYALAALGAFASTTQLFAAAAEIEDEDRGGAFTVYGGRITDVPAWHDLVTEPQDAGFVDAYIAVVAMSLEFAKFREGAWVLEGESQVAYNFGDQHHWEFNVAAMPRWRRFPWNHYVDTSVAFGLGLSWATEIPEVEVTLEGESHQLLVYWVIEVTFGPPDSRWDASFRLHHRSPAFGTFGDEGGMNAPSLGIRYSF